MWFPTASCTFDLPEVSQRLSATQVAIRNGEILLSQPTLKVELPTFEETENYSWRDSARTDSLRLLPMLNKE